MCLKDVSSASSLPFVGEGCANPLCTELKHSSVSSTAFWGVQFGGVVDVSKRGT